MVINYYGAQFFKIQLGDTVLALNPISKKSELKQTRFGADIALITTNQPDFNGLENVVHGAKEPFVVNGPGEYEVGGIFIKGISSGNGGGNFNTIYTIFLEGLNICFLGLLEKTELNNEVKEVIGNVDILFVPIGGDGVLGSSEASKLATKFEPKVIIPMHYHTSGGKDALKRFLKENGTEDLKPIEKLTIKRKDVETMNGEIVVLNQN